MFFSIGGIVSFKGTIMGFVVGLPLNFVWV